MVMAKSISIIGFILIINCYFIIQNFKLRNYIAKYMCKCILIKFIQTHLGKYTYLYWGVSFDIFFFIHCDNNFSLFFNEHKGTKPKENQRELVDIFMLSNI